MLLSPITCQRQDLAAFIEVQDFHCRDQVFHMRQLVDARCLGAVSRFYGLIAQISGNHAVQVKWEAGFLEPGLAGLLGQSS